MEASHFDEIAFFTALDSSGARALLIGRRALVLLGLPVLTADYDFWIAIDDIEIVNGVAAQFDLQPSYPAPEARRRGRYVLENDEHIDVLVARSVPTLEAVPVNFDDLWSARRRVNLSSAAVWIPSVEGLILTKQMRSRPKDLEDLRLLRALKDLEP